MFLEFSLMSTILLVVPSSKLKQFLKNRRFFLINKSNINCYMLHGVFMQNRWTKSVMKKKHNYKTLCCSLRQIFSTMEMHEWALLLVMRDLTHSSLALEVKTAGPQIIYFFPFSPSSSLYLKKI